MSYMCLGAYAFGVPIVIVIVLNFLLGLNISWETMFFITLAVGSIISVHGAKIYSLDDKRTLSIEELGKP